MDVLDVRQRVYAAYGVMPVIPQVQGIPGGQYLPYIGLESYSFPPSTFEDTLFTASADNELNFAGGRLSKSGNLSNVFAPPLLMAFRKVKNTIVTQLDSGSLPPEERIKAGTEIVERFSDSEWEIRIQGLVIDMGQHLFPLAKTEQLVKFFELPQAVEVSGQIWQAHGIKNVWFSDFEDSGVPGFQDTLQFSMMARSIRPAEFYLNNEEAEQ